MAFIVKYKPTNQHTGGMELNVDNGQCTRLCAYETKKMIQTIKGLKGILLRYVF